MREQPLSSLKRVLSKEDPELQAGAEAPELLPEEPGVAQGVLGQERSPLMRQPRGGED